MGAWGEGGGQPASPLSAAPEAPGARPTSAHSLPAHHPLGAPVPCRAGQEPRPGSHTRPAPRQAPSSGSPAAGRGRGGGSRPGAAGSARLGPGLRGLRGPLTQADDRQLRPGARRTLRPRDRPQLHARPGRLQARLLPPRVPLGLRLGLGLRLPQRLRARRGWRRLGEAAVQAGGARGHIGRGVTGPAGAQRRPPGRTPARRCPHAPGAQPRPACAREPPARPCPAPCRAARPAGATGGGSVGLVLPPGPSPARSFEAAPRQPRDAPAEPQWRWRGGRRRRGGRGARALLGCWTAPRPPLRRVRALWPWRAWPVGLSPRAKSAMAWPPAGGARRPARECWAARGRRVGRRWQLEQGAPQGCLGDLRAGQHVVAQGPAPPT